MGPLPFSLAYFVYHKEWQKRNRLTDKDLNVRKVLTRTWENKIDWWAITVCTFSAGVQMVIFISVILAFKASRQAGLNIGITTAIWSCTPFMVAFMEFILYRVRIRLYQIVGMIMLVAMVLLVSLADLFNPSPKPPQELMVMIDAPTERVPVYVAVSYAFLYPVIASFLTLFIKYVNKLRLETSDWMIAQNLILALVLTPVGILHFLSNPGTFVWAYFI